MKLAYDVYSPPAAEETKKTPLILLHGRMDSKKTWKKLAPEIAKKTCRKVYALDARNHGESSWSQEMDFEILANDLEEFMNDHDISKAVLVGHSMGGRTALTFALSKPEKVEKLFIEDVTVSYSPTVKSTVSQIFPLLRRSLTAIPPGADELTAKKSVCDFMNSFFKSPSKGSFMYDPDTVPLKRVDNGYQWQANLDVLEDMLKNKSNQTLSGVYNGEALFLYGTESFFNVKEDELIPKYFPKAVKVAVERAGHFIHHGHSGEFLDELLKFV